MFLLVGGIVVFLITGGVFVSLLPRGGQRHRWVDTEFEPYVSVGICAGVALSCTMMLSAVINMLSGA